MINYKYNVSIDTYDVGPDNKIRLSSILKYQEEAGEKQMTDDFHLDYNTIRERGVVFVITNCEIKINRLPTLKENVTVNTWSRVIKGIKFIRSFSWCDENGNVLMDGNSACVLVNAKTHKIMRPDALGYELPQDKEHITIAPIPKKIHLPAELENVGEKKIWYSMLDSNNHLNNSFYADFITDFASREFLQNPTSFAIDFVKEALCDDVVVAMTKIENNSCFIDGLTDGSTCFRARIEK